MGQMRAQMRAARFHAVGEPLRVEEVPIPEVGSGQVRVRIAACGLCGSDIHFLEGMPVPGGLPIVLGHEPSGTVDVVGEGVTGWSEGDRVALTLGDGCGQCASCRTGHPNACPSLIVPGIHVDGAFAEFMVVPASALVRVPEGVSMAAAAVASDCVATPYHALVCRAGIQPGEDVAVIGTGGLGTQAIALAGVLGAGRIVAVDLSEAALEHAVKAGATHTVLARPGVDPSAEIREAVGGGVTGALECVGAPDPVLAGLHSLLPGGRLVLVGVGMMPPPVDLPQALISFWEYSILGTFGSHREDLDAVLRLEADGRIDIASGISHRVPLEGVPEGLEMLMTKRDDPQRIVMEL